MKPNCAASRLFSAYLLVAIISLAPVWVVDASAAGASADLTFVCMGDARSSKANLDGGVTGTILREVAGKAILGKPRFALFLGDPIFGSREMGSFMGQMKVFLGAMKPLTDFCPVYYTFGNHESRLQEEVDWMVKNLNGHVAETGYKGVAYSFDVGNCHIVSVATMLPGEVNSISPEQLAWLEADLSANRDAGHIFVMGHSPAYPAGPHVHSALDARPAERDRFWALLAKHRVDAYLCAHEHLYNSKVAGGVRQILTGSCGAPLAKGFGGSFYHFARFTVRGPNVKVEVIDQKGAKIETLEWTRPESASRESGPFSVENLTPVPEYPAAGHEAYQAAYRAFYLENYVEAVGRFHALLTNEKDGAAREGALSCMAVSCMKTDNEEMAEGIYLDLVALFPGSKNLPVWCAKLGEILANDLEWAEAAGWYEKAALSAEGLESGEFLLKAGDCFELDNDASSAVGCYRRVTSICPGTTSLAVQADSRIKALGFSE